jgi:hypothetical protein
MQVQNVHFCLKYYNITETASRLDMIWFNYGIILLLYRMLDRVQYFANQGRLSEDHMFQFTYLL